jgi:hypothetical protein
MNVMNVMNVIVCGKVWGGWFSLPNLVQKVSLPNLVQKVWDVVTV